MWLPRPNPSTCLTKPGRTSLLGGLLRSAISRPPLQCREHPPPLRPVSPRESDIHRRRLTRPSAHAHSEESMRAAESYKASYLHESLPRRHTSQRNAEPREIDPPDRLRGRSHVSGRPSLTSHK